MSHISEYKKCWESIVVDDDEKKNKKKEITNGIENDFLYIVYSVSMRIAFIWVHSPRSSHSSMSELKKKLSKR